LKNTSVIKVVITKKYGQFLVYAKEAIMCSHQINVFQSTKINDVLWCDKGTSQAEATSNSEKIKPVALAIIELR